MIFCVLGSHRPILFEPCSVSQTEPSGRRHGRMNRGGTDVGNREILHLAGLRIEPGDLIRHAEIGNPQVAVFVRSGAERHAARARHVVLDVHDIHRVAAERPHRVLVSWHVRGRFRQHGIGAEQTRQIRGDIVGILIGEARQR